MPNIRKSETASLADTVTTEFILIQSPSGADAKIRTAAGNAGTIQFAVSVKGSVPVLTSAFAFASGQTINLKIGRNESLYAKASAGTQSFTVEY